MKKRFSSDELYALRNFISINMLIKEVLALPCKTADGYFRFLCPICNEFQTATNASTNLARCFYCERNFNVIDLVMIINNSAFVESVTFLKDILTRSPKRNDTGCHGKR